MTNAETTPSRSLRNLRACDICRSRKIKCLYSDGESSCQGCMSAGFSCTQDKPRRKRGPAKRNLHRRTPCDALTTVSNPRAFTSPLISESSSSQLIEVSLPDFVTQTSSPITRSTSDFHGLGPRSLILTILTDWARFVYPLAPLLHKKRFLRRILHLEDVENPTFCALVLSTCAVTISTLRRRSFGNYPSVTVDKCIAVINQERLLPFVSYNLEWCITSYNVASSLNALYGLDDVRVYKALNDAMAGAQWLLFHDKEVRSLADQEMLKRLYWLLAMWQLSAELRGQPHLKFLPSPPFSRTLKDLRPKPLPDAELEVCDTEIDASLLWPELSAEWLNDDEEFVSGLNGLVDILLVWERVKIDMTHKEPENTLRDSMADIQSALDNLIPELRWRGGLARYPKPSQGHEAQMVNILITSLYVRSNLLQYLGQALDITHESIASDVLEVLDHIPQEAQESNGFSLVKKLRDIGAAYLQDLQVTSDGPLQVTNEVAQRTVNALLARLETLDFKPQSTEG